jgi:hypothetical protein
VKSHCPHPTPGCQVDPEHGSGAGRFCQTRRPVVTSSRSPPSASRKQLRIDVHLGWPLLGTNTTAMSKEETPFSVKSTGRWVIADGGNAPSGPRELFDYSLPAIIAPTCRRRA